MNQSERDRTAYALAYDYILALDVKGVTRDLLQKYLQVPEERSHPDSMPRIYQSILEAAQNAGMKPTVIGKAIGGVGKLGFVLCDFDPAAVLAKYAMGWEQVLDDVERYLHPVGKVRRTPKSIWPHYCRTILSAAEFLVRFDTADDFYHWADFFDQDTRARTALPLLLSMEVAGLGFALSCDFLKELGYVNYAKPDVHIRDIFTNLQLCSRKAHDYEVYKAVVRVATNVGVTPYNADKLFWLIGSGYFYDDEHIGSKGKIGSLKRGFAQYARNHFNMVAS